MTPDRSTYHIVWRCVALALVLMAPIHAVEPIRTYAIAALKDGRMLKTVEIISYTSSGVFVRHSGGVTTLRRDVLPDRILSDLHLPKGEVYVPTVDPSLADKPAVAESLMPALAHRPAVAARATAAGGDFPGGAGELEALAEKPAVASDEPAPPTSALAADAPVPAGEGNIAEFFVKQTAPIASAAVSSRPVIAGRVVVRLPSGEMRLLGDVSIRAYPAQVLTGYIEKAKARCEFEARRLIEQALTAEKAGGIAEAQALFLRAREVSARYLDDLPVAPNSTRSDEFGFFTLSHELPDVRLVAEGRVSGPMGSWHYEWVGIAPAGETLLNEGNATAVIAPVANAPKYTVR